MFVDSFTLKKNSWHAKLMWLTWHLETRDFSHICPYFWLSIANVLILPLTLVIYALYYMVKYPVKWYNDMIESFETKRREEYNKWLSDEMQKLKTDDTYWDVVTEKLLASNSCSRKYQDLMFRHYKWQVHGEAYDKFIQWRDKYFNLEHERDRIEEERRELVKQQSFQVKLNQKAKVNWLLKIVKPLTKVFLVILTGVILWVIYILGKLLINWISTWKITVVLANLKTIGILLLLCLGVTVIVLFIRWLFLKMKHSLRIPCHVTDKIGNFFIMLLVPFVWIGGGIGLLFRIIGQMIRNNCPAIEWK